jgi:hypothetical protein
VYPALPPDLRPPRSPIPDVHRRRGPSCERNPCWAACTTSTRLGRRRRSRRETYTGRWTDDGKRRSAEVRCRGGRTAFLRSTVPDLSGHKPAACVSPPVAGSSASPCTGGRPAELYTGQETFRPSPFRIADSDVRPWTLTAVTVRARGQGAHTVDLLEPGESRCGIQELGHQPNLR